MPKLLLVHFKCYTEGNLLVHSLSSWKSSWTNKIPLHSGQLGSVTNYLNDLKMELVKAAEHAAISCRSKQESYAHYHNRRARHKKFKSGDQVIVLIPDSSHKLYVRWTALASIIERKSLYRYLVQMPDNSFRHLHASKIRELKAQTTHVGVIYDADIDFRDIENIPLIATEDSRNWNKELSLHHLSSKQKRQFIDILNNYSNV